MQIGVESARSVENRRIFVVDEDEINRAALQFMLHDENETHEFSGIDAALEKSANWKPDLLILGIGMVEAGLLQKLKERIDDLSIMIVTDAENLSAAVACLKSGADAIVAKPLFVEIVRGKVDALFERRLSWQP